MKYTTIFLFAFLFTSCGRNIIPYTRNIDGSTAPITDGMNAAINLLEIKYDDNGKIDLYISNGRLNNIYFPIEDQFFEIETDECSFKNGISTKFENPDKQFVTVNKSSNVKICIDMKKIFPKVKLPFSLINLTIQGYFRPYNTDNWKNNDSLPVMPFYIQYRSKIIETKITRISAQQVDAPEPATMVSPALKTPHRPAR